MSIISNLIKMFSKKHEVVEEVKVNFEDKKPEEDYDFGSIEEPEYSGNLDSDKVLLVVDDIELSKALYESDFKYIKKITTENSKHIDIMEEYKIVWCIGKGCSLKAYKYINIDRNPLSVCLFDITIGESFRTNSGSYIEFSGIDLAHEVFKIDDQAKVRFITAHTMNDENNVVAYIKKSFKELTGRDIDSYVINKNSRDRYEKLIELLG